MMFKWSNSRGSAWRICSYVLYALGMVVAGVAVPSAFAAETKGAEDYEVLLKNQTGSVTFDDSEWKEVDVFFPATPREESWRVIDVNKTSENRFYIDESSVDYGVDKVVRYTMIIVSSGGAKNVSFEGIRCDTRESRVYAFLRNDGSWSKARTSAWAKIDGTKLNPYHAALFRDYFCTPGASVGDTETARRVLRNGNPAATLVH